jgi:hypothetical protein
VIDLPRERQPDPALEERVVAALASAGLVRRRRPRGIARSVVWLAAAAVLVLAIGVTTWWAARPAVAPGYAYVILLRVDSTYRYPPPGHMRERVTEIARWADSLQHLGELERGGKLVGSGPAGTGGMFIVRAANDSIAARIGASCPHLKHGGKVDVLRYME